MPRNHVRGGWLAATASLSILISACQGGAGGPRPPQSTGPTSSNVTSAAQTPKDALFASYFTKAQQGHASNQQLAILSKGNVSYSDYSASVGRSLACMRSAGLDVIGDFPTTLHGLTVINYSFGGSTMSGDQSKGIGDQCLAEHSQYVEAVYQLQPSSQETLDRYFDRFKAPLVECIKANHGTADANASREQLLDIAWEVQTKTGVNCEGKVGYA